MDMNLGRLVSFKAIQIEEQQRYYLTHKGEDKGGYLMKEYLFERERKNIGGIRTHLRGSYDKFPDIFRVSTFIDSAYMKF